MAFSHSALTVKTGGQTLVVTAYRSGSTSVTVPLHLTSAVAGAQTQPYTITTDTTFYIPDDHAGFWVVSVKQPDGTELWGQEEYLGAGEKVIAPLPSAAQIAADGSTDPFGRLKTGHYYVTTTANATSTSALSSGRLHLAQWYVPKACTIDRLGAEITTVGTAGSVFRIGIYKDTGDGMPGDLLLDAGTIDGTSQTVQTVTVSQALNRGVYWFGGAAQVADCTVCSTPIAYSGFAWSYLTSAPTAAQKVGGYYQTGVTGALPATYTTTPTIASVNAQPRIFFRVA